MASLVSLGSKMATLNKASSAASAAAAAAAAAATGGATKGRGVPVRVATGIVIRAGTCDKTVKVRLGGEIWNDKVKKYFKTKPEHLVHDPNNSLREGDIIEVQGSWRTSKAKRFVVNKIVAPFGLPIEDRPPVPTPAERETTKAAEREAKVSRRNLRKTRERLEVQFEKSTEMLNKMIAETSLKDRVLGGTSATTTASHP